MKYSTEKHYQIILTGEREREREGKRGKGGEREGGRERGRVGGGERERKKER